MTRHRSTKGRIPRVARLLALAHRFDRLIAEGVLADYAELARLGQVSRARISQIMSLLYLAPDIQEVILFWQSRRGRDSVSVADLLAIAARWDWQEQRRLWRQHVLPKTRQAFAGVRSRRRFRTSEIPPRLLIPRHDL